MIRPISFGNAEQPGALSNVAEVKPVPAKETAIPQQTQDTFTPAKPEEAVKADPNDKFEKAEEKPAEEKK